MPFPIKVRPNIPHIERTLAYCTGVDDYRNGKQLRNNPYRRDIYILYTSWREGYLTEMRRSNRDKDAGALKMDCINKHLVG